MSIWVSACDGETITLNKILFLYHLKASTHYGYFELFPWDRKSRIVRGFNFIFSRLEIMIFFLFLEQVRKPCLTISGGKSQDYYENGKSQHLVRISVVLFCLSSISWFFIALDRPDLEDKNCHRVRAALAYACEIEDFDNLVDPHRLFDCYLGPRTFKIFFRENPLRREE